MPNPQQPEVRRSEKVPALDPDASEAVLSAQAPLPAVDSPDGPVPEDQRPGHRPAQDQDKPDLDAMAKRLGVVPDDEVPDDAPHVDPDDTAADAEEQRKAREARLEARAGGKPASGFSRSRIKIGLLVAAPAVAFVVGRAMIRAARRPRLPFS